MAMRPLPKRKAPGPDDIPNGALKLVHQHSPHSLLEMYNECLAAGVFASRWKVARLVLVTEREEDSESPTTHRPLRMMDTAGKVLEKLVRARLHKAIENNTGPSARQYGFGRGGSTVNALREVSQEVARAETYGYKSPL